MEIVGDKETASPRHCGAAQLSCLPPEIFETILPQVGGYACISLRRTCKRLKMMVDEMEMRLVPCIWHRYLYTDFSEACIKSIMPWAEEIKGKDNNYNWKMIYSGLYNSVNQHKDFIRKKVQFQSDCDIVRNISFVGSQLFIHDGICSTFCIGLKSRLKPDLVMPVTDLCYYVEDDQCAEAICLRIDHASFEKDVIFKPFAIVDQANPIVKACRMMMRPFFLHFLKSPPCVKLMSCRPNEEVIMAMPAIRTYVKDRMLHTELALMHYDDKLSISAFGQTIVFCHHTSYDPDDDEFIFSETELPHNVKSIHRLGNLLIVVVHGAFNNVFTTLMRVDDSGMIQVGGWHQLYLPGTNNQIMGEKVCDADVVGYALVLITDLGKVFLSNVEEPSHEAIQRKLYLACEIEGPSSSISNFFVRLDLNNGFVITILEENKNITVLLAV